VGCWLGAYCPPRKVGKSLTSSLDQDLENFRHHFVRMQRMQTARNKNYDAEVQRLDADVDDLLKQAKRPAPAGSPGAPGPAGPIGPPGKDGLKGDTGIKKKLDLNAWSEWADMR
jgi:hypothetical protein